MLSLDELMGLPPPRAARSRGGHRGQPSWLQQQVEALATLPKARQQFISQMLATVLAQASSQPATR